jgi:hypothetical protein
MKLRDAVAQDPFGGAARRAGVHEDLAGARADRSEQPRVLRRDHQPALRCACAYALGQLGKRACVLRAWNTDDDVGAAPGRNGLARA